MWVKVAGLQLHKLMFCIQLKKGSIIWNYSPSHTPSLRPHPLPCSALVLSFHLLLIIVLVKPFCFLQIFLFTFQEESTKNTISDANRLSGQKTNGGARIKEDFSCPSLLEAKVWELQSIKLSAQEPEYHYSRPPYQFVTSEV